MSMSNKNVSGRVRIGFDFATPEAALEFIDWIKDNDPRYGDADAFEMDGMDNSKKGITDGDTYLVKNAKDRIPGTALRDEWDQKHWFDGVEECDTCGQRETSPLHRSK